MRIFFLTASLGAGGAERVVSLLANEMAGRGHEVEVICLKFNDVYYQIHPNVKVVLAVQQTRNRLTELFWLRKYIKVRKPDVVIPFTEGVYCFTIFALLGVKISIIASERLDPSAMSWLRKLLKRLLLPYTDWLVVQTQHIKEYFPKKIQEKTSIIYNPVNEKVFESPIAPIKKENRIISVGRLYPQKNQQMMIRAFAKIAQQFPDWQLVVYGDGPLRSELETLIRYEGLENRIFLPGRTEDVIGELRRSKIFCLSSDYEGMSNALIEAICVGLPIVSTKVSGTEKLIKDGGGFLIRVGDEIGLAESMSKLMLSTGLREDMSKINMELSDTFKVEVIVDQWLQLIHAKIKDES